MRNNTLRISDFLVIIAVVLLFFGAGPIAGALYARLRWHRFRRCFDELRLRSLLHYEAYCKLEKTGGIFRFLGGFESITDNRTLWIQGDNLTLPVSLSGAEAWLLPMQWGDVASKNTCEGEMADELFDPVEEAPERIRWNRIATFAEGVRVFVGGCIRFQDGCWRFVSTKETPLLLVFYDCGDRVLTPRTIHTGRQRHEYWNGATPYSLALGAIALLYIAYTFLNRPAFQLTVIVSLVALFVPLMPLIPPGLLFTILYRRLSWQARRFRACRDLARLPLRYLEKGKTSAALPSGERYGYVKLNAEQAALADGNIPFLVPGYARKKLVANCYVFGALGEEGSLPVRPEDPFATFGALPAEPEKTVSRYAISAYLLEAAAWTALLAGIGLNIFFVITVIRLL